MPYSYKDLLLAYESVGVRKNSVVHVTGNLMLLMDFDSRDKKAPLKAHEDALFEILGKNGTLVVPTQTLYLCNSNIPFHPQTTACTNGVLPEHIRNHPSAHRSFHPFVSWSAIGEKAEWLTGNISRHAYGPETPVERLIREDALHVSIGMHPSSNTSVVHHVEMMMGVPYRYTKEFIHPVCRENEIKRELFYLYVYYKECEIQRDKNQKIFRHFEQNHSLKKAKIGRGYIYAFSMKAFFTNMVQFLREDIYGWLKTAPTTRPYQK